MLPDFSMNECCSMHDMPHNDFTQLTNVPETALSFQEKEMCPIPINKYHKQQEQKQQQQQQQQQQQTFIESYNKHRQTDNNNNNNNGKRKERNSNEKWQFLDRETILIHDSQRFLNHNHLYHRYHHHQQYDRHNKCSNHKLLLQNSEDPLISHGADTILKVDEEESPIEFAKCLMDNEHIKLRSNKQLNQLNQLINTQSINNRRTTIRSGCSYLTKQQLKAKASIMSAKNREQQQQQQQQQQQEKQQEQSNINNVATTSNITISKQRYVKMKKRLPTTTTQQGSIKLRFHHQALPPQYLSHFEATQGHLQSMQQEQQQQQQQKQQKQKQTSTTSSNSKTSCRNDFHNQQQQCRPKVSHCRNSHENVRSWLQKIAEIHRNATANQLAAVNGTNNSTNNNNDNTKTHRTDNNNNNINKCKTLKSSLLNNSSVDQTNCKTIEFCTNDYSNLPYMGEITLDHTKPRRGRKPKKADICHLIYKNYGTTTQKSQTTLNFTCTNNINATQMNQIKANGKLHISKNKHSVLSTSITEKVAEDQPLNLCLRDHNIDTLSLTSGDEDDDITETNSSCPTPITTPSDILRDTMLAANMKQALTPTQTLQQKTEKGELFARNSLNSYYQKILENSSLIKQFHGGLLETIQKDNQLALKIPLPNGLLSQQIKTEKPSTITSQSFSPSKSNDIFIDRSSTPSSLKSDISLGTAISVNSIQPQKRKRSAIYIPPLPTDTSTASPANEVSICKFKFTGGANPTLEEKKMLSVDAEGNYRYFSGTGGKASRGYEYFPRESLQQKADLLPGINVGGDKHNLNPVSSLLESHLQGLIHERKPLESSKSLQLSQPCSLILQTDQPYSVINNRQLRGTQDEDLFDRSLFKDATTEECDSKKSNVLNQHHVKRNTQREKLEKTFKEQGFLIQTQQLECAEGATYCKFRQLKKFSRYLFRSWKDYLPEELQQQREQKQPQPQSESESELQQEQEHHYEVGQYDKKISSLRVNSVQQAHHDDNDTEMTEQHALRPSLKFVKSEVQSTLTNT